MARKRTKETEAEPISFYMRAVVRDDVYEISARGYLMEARLNGKPINVEKVDVNFAEGEYPVIQISSRVF